MKIKLSVMISAVIQLLVLTLCRTPAGAAEVNSMTVDVGDTIDYELHVSNCPEKIQALDVSVYYDPSSLELVPYSLELPNISGFMTNTDLTGEVRFNAIDFDGFSFEGDKILSKLQFKVIDSSAYEITLNYEIKTFLDSNTVDLKDTYIYDYTDVTRLIGEESENPASMISSTVVSDTSQSSQISESSASEPISDSTLDFYGITGAEENSAAVETQAEPYVSSVIKETSGSDDRDNLKLYLIMLAAAVAVIIVIGIIFKMAVKNVDS